MPKEVLVNCSQSPELVKELPQTLNDWIAQDPERAKKEAQKLLPPHLAQPFIARVDGAKNGEIAREIGKKTSTVRYYVSLVRARLAETHGGLARESSKPLVIILAEKQLRQLFEQARQGDETATIRIISHWQGALNAQLKQIPAERKALFLAEFFKKMHQDFQRIEWQGTQALLHRVQKSLYHAGVSEFRKQTVRDKQVRNEKQPAKPAKGSLTVWLNEHPDESERLLDSLSQWQRQVFIAKKIHGLSIKDIEELFPERSTSSIKVALHRATRHLKSKIETIQAESGLRESEQQVDLVGQESAFAESIGTGTPASILGKESVLPKDVDNKTIEKAKACDLAALTEIHQVYFPRVYRYCYSATDNEEEALSLTITIFVKMVDGLSQNKYSAKHPFGIWFFGITHRIVEDWKRGHQILVTSNRLVQAVNKLKNDEQRVIGLHFASDLSFPEIAKALGKSETQVKDLIFWGLNKLKEQETSLVR